LAELTIQSPHERPKPQREPSMADLALIFDFRMANPSVEEFVLERLLKLSNSQVILIRDASVSATKGLQSRLWGVVLDADRPASSKLNACSFLARLDPSSSNWERVDLAELLESTGISVDELPELLQPIAAKAIALHDEKSIRFLLRGRWL
jgi:hypothetical protein